MLRSLVKELQQFTISGTDGEIGRVDHFLFDDRQWVVRYLVVDTGTWLPGRRVLISPQAISAVHTDRDTVELNLTRQKIQDSPHVDTEQPASRVHEAAFDSYFGYGEYWGIIGGPGGPASWAHPPGGTLPPGPNPGGDESRRTAGDPHLRSTREVAGYALQATDDEIGHIKDFVADDDGWAIRYLVVGTGTWIGGKNVLISREWVHRIEWEASKVYVDVTREQVKDSPEYDPSQLLNREGEEQLHGHYARKGYWTPGTSG